MAKIIIGIHGLGNKPASSILEKWWSQAIEEGLNKNIGENAPKPIFKMVYWADVVYGKPLNETITDKENPYYLREPYLPGSNTLETEEHTVRKKILNIIVKQINKVFLNDDFSINYSFISDTIIRKFFKDLDAYYSQGCTDENKIRCSVKERLRGRLKDVLLAHKNDEILLIGHSMGSIIAYDVLSLFPSDVKVNTFITIGSPLGLPVVVSKIAAELNINHSTEKKLTAPLAIKKQWYNFSDIEDRVSINYMLADDFSPNKKGLQVIDMEVSNNYEINNHRNPHKSYGYLRTPEVSNIIYNFMVHKRTPGYHKLWKRFGNLYSRIKRGSS